MGFTLFDIDEQISALLDAETGEVSDYDMLEQLQMEREKKITNIALAYKNLAAEEKALAEQEANFKARKNAVKNRKDRCKQLLDYALDGEKFKNTMVSVYYKKSTKVDVWDMTKIPDAYLRHMVEVDKSLIKTAIENGCAIPGATLEESVSVIVQ
jgi:hypothetical protein